MMEFVMVSKILYEIDEDVILDSVDDFMEAVKNGKVKMTPYEMEVQDKDGNDILNNDEYREIGKLFMELNDGEA
jgi:hypothetical protein